MVVRLCNLHHITRRNIIYNLLYALAFVAIKDLWVLVTRENNGKFLGHKGMAEYDEVVKEL